jgi:hypothetical protein
MIVSAVSKPEWHTRRVSKLLSLQEVAQRGSLISWARPSSVPVFGMIHVRVQSIDQCCVILNFCPEQSDIYCITRLSFSLLSLIAGLLVPTYTQPTNVARAQTHALSPISNQTIQSTLNFGASTCQHRFYIIPPPSPTLIFK